MLNAVVANPALFEKTDTEFVAVILQAYDQALQKSFENMEDFIKLFTPDVGVAQHRFRCRNF